VTVKEVNRTKDVVYNPDGSVVHKERIETVTELPETETIEQEITLPDGTKRTIRRT